MTINFDLSKPHEVITDMALAQQGDFFVGQYVRKGSETEDGGAYASSELIASISGLLKRDYKGIYVGGITNSPYLHQKSTSKVTWLERKIYRYLQSVREQIRALKPGTVFEMVGTPDLLVRTESGVVMAGRIVTLDSFPDDAYTKVTVVS